LVGCDWEAKWVAGEAAVEGWGAGLVAVAASAGETAGVVETADVVELLVVEVDEAAAGGGEVRTIDSSMA